LTVVKEEIGFAVRLQILVGAGCQSVFNAVTKPERIVKWDYPDRVQLDPRVRGWIRLREGNVEREGRITAYSPPREFTYKIPTPFPAPERNKKFAATIQFVLDDLFGRTRVRLRHSGFPQKSFAVLEERAWHNIYLPRLKEYCESVEE